jgi:hypothetical protein
MALVTSEATQSFVNTDRSPVIAAANLHSDYRRVALVAEGLANVRADLYQALAVAHRRQRQLIETDVVEFAPIKERERGGRNILNRSRGGGLHSWAYEQVSLPVHLVTRQA